MAAGALWWLSLPDTDLYLSFLVDLATNSGFLLFSSWSDEDQNIGFTAEYFAPFSVHNPPLGHHRMPKVPCCSSLKSRSLQLLTVSHESWDERLIFVLIFSKATESLDICWAQYKQTHSTCFLLILVMSSTHLWVCLWTFIVVVDNKPPHSSQIYLCSLMYFDFVYQHVWKLSLLPALLQNTIQSILHSAPGKTCALILCNLGLFYWQRFVCQFACSLLLLMEMYLKKTQLCLTRRDIPCVVLQRAFNVWPPAVSLLGVRPTLTICCWRLSNLGCRHIDDLWFLLWFLKCY